MATLVDPPSSDGVKPRKAEASEYSRSGRAFPRRPKGGLAAHPHSAWRNGASSDHHGGACSDRHSQVRVNHAIGTNHEVVTGQYRDVIERCYGAWHAASPCRISGALHRLITARSMPIPGLLAWTDKTVGTHSELDCTRKLVWGNQRALWSTTELAHVRARLATALTGRSRHSRIIPSCWESWIQAFYFVLAGLEHRRNKSNYGP